MSVKSAKTKRNTDGEKETWEYKREDLLGSKCCCKMI